MERDLNFRKLFKMYCLNLWIMILAGIIVAAGIVVFIKGTNETIITRSIFLVYSLDGADDTAVEVKMNSYFSAYKALLEGNTLLDSPEFSDDEQSKLKNMAVEVSSSCYTITMRGEDLDESDEDALDKYVAVSQEWMREKYEDDSIEAEIVNSSTQVSSGRSVALKAAVGFVIGAVLAAIGLFIWFVADRKVRDEDDIVYYTGLNCLSVVKRR